MRLSGLFTEEEQQYFFEREGYKVEKRKFKKEVKITHGWYELEEYEKTCVKVGKKWCFMNVLFEKVMQHKLKVFLIEKYDLDFLFIERLAKELASNEEI